MIATAGNTRTKLRRRAWNSSLGRAKFLDQRSKGTTAEAATPGLIPHLPAAYQDRVTTGDNMRMERARTGALTRMTTSGVTACILLGAGAGSARAALTAPATSVPCKVSALAAAIGSATAGETLTLATECVYHLTQAVGLSGRCVRAAGRGSGRRGCPSR